MERIRDLPPATRMHAVYAVYGKAMMSAHALERRLASILVAHISDITVPNDTRAAQVARIDRMTFGQLIKEFILTQAPTEELVEELDNMLYFRNELAHRIADTVLAAAMAQEWEERLIERLTEWDLMFRETSDLLHPYTSKWIEKHNINFDKVFSAVLKIYPGITNLA